MTAIVWFRQDLRTHDNPALTEACNHHQQVIPLYIAAENPVRTVPGAQRWWLHHSLKALSNELKSFDMLLCLRHGSPLIILEELIKKHDITAVYWNRCYEPESIDRDTLIKSKLIEQGIEVQSFNGSLLNEPWTVKNQQGHFFKVFTPYWKQALRQIDSAPELSLKKSTTPTINSDKLEDWQLIPSNPNWAQGFSEYWEPGEAGALKKLDYFVEHCLNHYKEERDIPSLAATSRLSPHLHFGEISPRIIWNAILRAKQDPESNHRSADHFLSELGWREFSYHLLYHFPELPVKNFKSQFNDFPWHDNREALRCWQKGLTGYPIVDAGMRELWQTGTMHNRVRMICASFLVKDLLIDWRAGAEWFYDTLLDADLANNSASWQWVAGSGADAAPYFRIFNPVLQSEKFDPDGHYIKRWIPELRSVPRQWIHNPWEAPSGQLGLRLGIDYPKPIVDHSQARQLALAYYQQLSLTKPNSN